MRTKTDAQLIAELSHQLAATRRAYLVSLLLLAAASAALIAYGPWAA